MAHADPSSNRNLHVGTRYLAGATLCAVSAGTIGGPAWLLAYPAISLLLVAASYLSRRTGLLEKRGTCWTPLTTLLLAPYLAGAWCSWRLYMRAITPWTEIAPRVFVGRRLDNVEAHRLLARGDLAVIDLAPELPECGLLARQDYTHVGMLDLVPPTAAQLDRVLALLQSRLDAGKIVFIHCSLGLYRGPLVLAAWLTSTGMRPVDAGAHIHRLRPQVIIDVHHL